MNQGKPNRFHVLAADYDTEPAELLLGLIGTAWGIWTILPCSTITLSPLGLFMLRMAPQMVWGLIFVLIGGAQLMAAIWIRRRFRSLAGLAAMMWWSWMFTAAVLSNWHTVATPILFVYFIFEAWIVYRTI